MIRSVLFLACAALATAAAARSKAAASASAFNQATYDSFADIPVTTPKGFKLESVFLFGRHGNRAPDPLVATVCPNRAVQSRLYKSQGCAPGAMTVAGLQSIWDLGRYTHDLYVKTGYVPSAYNRAYVNVRAAASDRTLISASAWGQTAFPSAPAGAPAVSPSIPVATFSVPPEQDNFAEVRKARCAARLEEDLHEYDADVAPALLKQYRPLINKISAACGFDITTTPDVTNGEFSVLQAVKDVADALTGDFLEGFPLMEGLTAQDRDNFLSFAELMFHKRHYGGAAQPAYLAGAAPNRVVKLFDRRVSWNANETARELDLESHHAALAAADADPPSVVPVRAPRRVYAFHCHREILYGLVKFLGLRVDVTRPNLPRGLVHPGSGIFFELWRDPAAAHAAQLANAEAPALDPNRKNKLRYALSPVDEGYYVRVVVWVPCWKGDGLLGNATAEAANGTPCPGRVRVLPGCGGKEFCRYDEFKRLLADGFNAVGGDFRDQCPMPVPEAVAMVAADTARKARSGRRRGGKRGGKRGAVSAKLALLESPTPVYAVGSHHDDEDDEDSDSEAALHAADAADDIDDAHTALAAHRRAAAASEPYGGADSHLGTKYVGADANPIPGPFNGMSAPVRAGKGHGGNGKRDDSWVSRAAAFIA